MVFTTYTKQRNKTMKSLNMCLYTSMHGIIVKSFKIGDKVKLVDDLPYMKATFKALTYLLDKDMIYTIDDINVGHVSLAEYKGENYYFADFFKKVEKQ